MLILLAGYGVIKALPLLEGPRLTLSSPLDGARIDSGVVEITGVARHTEKLTLDGAPLLIDEHGNVSTTLTLPRGGAILSLTVSDRFGRSHTVERTVYVP